MARPIIIDTDPGQDDAIAILLALASPELEVLGITTVAGNVSLARTTENALALTELAGRTDVRVYAGCDRPLVRESVSAEHVHGETGLNGANLPASTTATGDAHAVDWIIDTLRAAPRPVTLCPLGPLTNLALAIRKAPDVVAHIEEIVAMGGAVRTAGNITPAAEFNVFADPHAADIVLSAGCATTLMPLDVTHQALTTEARLARFAELPAPIGPACHGMLSFYYRPNLERFGQAGSPLHDPCVIAYLLAPELFTGKAVEVRVETSSPLTLGLTLADWWGSAAWSRPANAGGEAPKCTVMQTLDTEGFYALIFERLASLRGA